MSNQDKSNSLLMSIDELCETLDIGKNVAYQLLGSGNIEAFRVGRVWKIPRESVTKFIQEQASSKGQVSVVLTQYTKNKKE